jgi:hypothetical protein
MVEEEAGLKLIEINKVKGSPEEALKRPSIRQ